MLPLALPLSVPNFSSILPSILHPTSTSEHLLQYWQDTYTLTPTPMVCCWSKLFQITIQSFLGATILKLSNFFQIATQFFSWYCSNSSSHIPTMMTLMLLLTLLLALPLMNMLLHNSTLPLTLLTPLDATTDSTIDSTTESATISTNFITDSTTDFIMILPLTQLWYQFYHQVTNT